jgi:hypothetical protein
MVEQWCAHWGAMFTHSGLWTPLILAVTTGAVTLMMGNSFRGGIRWGTPLGVLPPSRGEAGDRAASV